jgi:outer membrane protein TolC
MRIAYLLFFCLLAMLGCQPDQPPLESQPTELAYSPSEEALREIVRVTELSKNRMQAIIDIDQGTSADMSRLQIQLAEARLALTVATGRQEDIVADLRVIVEHWDEQAKEQQLRQGMGQGNVIEANEVQIQLIKARDRLRQAEERTTR